MGPINESIDVIHYPAGEFPIHVVGPSEIGAAVGLNAFQASQRDDSGVRGRRLAGCQIN